MLSLRILLAGPVLPYSIFVRARATNGTRAHADHAFSVIEQFASANVLRLGSCRAASVSIGNQMRQQQRCVLVMRT